MVDKSSSVTVLDHPLAKAKLAKLRAKGSTTAEFRRRLQEISILLLAEASRSWTVEPATIETPMGSCASHALARPIALVPILRAGLGMLEGMSHIVPEATVGHIGLYRDETTLRPVKYYSRLPTNIAEAEVLLLDPMLATGYSACEAATVLKDAGARALRFICVVSCRPGIEQFHRLHPDVPIITAVIDPELNDVGYIVPGLGDAGDRYFAT
ncbi:MAG: uracil phosphoribosyltransferase [Chthoniobacterales bacterium]|nr:uracil phosphoribosyltransferase [Chthoniobacterales bacterium]